MGRNPNQCPALGKAVALARSELQVEIEGPRADEAEQGKGLRSRLGLGRYRSGATRGSSASADGNAAPWSGELIYCRAAVMADAPWDVKGLPQSDKRFPYHSALDQLFTDQKCESSCALGAHKARRAAVAHRQRLMHVRLRAARERPTITPAQLEMRLELLTGAAKLAAAIDETQGAGIITRFACRAVRAAVSAPNIKPSAASSRETLSV